MLCFCSIVAVFLLFSIIEASPAQILTRPNSILSQPNPLSSASSGLQLANVALNATTSQSGTEPHTECNAEYYGEPTIPSCLEVYRQMTDSDKVSVFGDRTKGMFKYPLPHRLSSGQQKFLLEDG